MLQLQGFGALLFGAVALAFVGALSVLYGGPSEISAALLAMFAAYGSQWCAFQAQFGYEQTGHNFQAHLTLALALQLTSIALASLAFIVSVWF